MDNIKFDLWHENCFFLWNTKTNSLIKINSKNLDFYKWESHFVREYGHKSNLFDEKQKKWLEGSNSSKDFSSSNLLIKGDNFWSLKYLQNTHKQRFKLIYLDPPYNTGTGEKKFLDSFGHKQYLTFMKNRLELIYPLLREDGILLLHLNKVELGYSQVLCDIIFGRNNFITIITWERSQRTLLGQGQTAINDTSEYILLYAKNRKKTRMNRIQRSIPLQMKSYQQYNKLISFGKYKTQLITVLNEDSNRPIQIYKHPNAQLETITLANFEKRYLEIEKFYIENYDRIVRLSNQQSESTLQQKIINNFPEKKGIFSVKYIPDRGKHAGKEITKFYFGSDVILFLKDYSNHKDNQLNKLEDMNNFWSHKDIPITGIAGEGRIKLKRGKKPEAFLKRILTIGSNPKDWILDAFGGSGTTAAVSHKIGRNWVILELPEPSKMIIERLNNVIQGKDQDKHAFKGGFQVLEVISNI
ncbi:MAG: DNA methyltransferase [Candidatus Hodarchaeales archaeon]